MRRCTFPILAQNGPASPGIIFTYLHMQVKDIERQSSKLGTFAFFLTLPYLKVVKGGKGREEAYRGGTAFDRLRQRLSGRIPGRTGEGRGTSVMLRQIHGIAMVGPGKRPAPQLPIGLGRG